MTLSLNCRETVCDRFAPKPRSRRRLIEMQSRCTIKSTCYGHHVRRCYYPNTGRSSSTSKSTVAETHLNPIRCITRRDAPPLYNTRHAHRNKHWYIHPKRHAPRKNIYQIPTRCDSTQRTILAPLPTCPTPFLPACKLCLTISSAAAAAASLSFCLERSLR